MTTENQNEDYLDVDKQINGQNYVCLSFLSPENMIEKRELYLLDKFRDEFCNQYNEWNENFKASYELLSNIKKNMPDTFLSEGDTIVIEKSEITKLNNQLSELQSKLDLWNFIDHKKSMNDFWEEFQINRKEYHEKEFLKLNNNAASIRGIKCRGVYNTIEEAQSRAKKLQKKDKYFNVYVGQVGYWLPWDPNPLSVENQEYAENRLNDLMRNYKNNQDIKDEVWQEQVNIRKQK